MDGAVSVCNFEISTGALLLRRAREGEQVGGGARDADAAHTGALRGAGEGEVATGQRRARCRTQRPRPRAPLAR